MAISKAQLLKANKKRTSSKKAAKAAAKKSYPKFLKAKADINKRLAIASLGSGAVQMNECEDQKDPCKCGQPRGNDEPDHNSDVTIAGGKATATKENVTVHRGKRRKIVWQIVTPGWVFDDSKPIYIAPRPGENVEKNFLDRFGWKFEFYPGTEQLDRTKLIVCGNANGGKRVACKYTLRMWYGGSTKYVPFDPALDCEE